MNPQEPVPNVGRSLLKRGALAGLVIVLLAAGSVSAAGFLQADSIINTIEKEGRAPINIPEIDRAQAGEAQTLMILGSDQRYGDKKLGLKPRSDTIILVRLDPDKEATAVMSVPRDLKVKIPGYGTDKINAAYATGGPRRTVATVKQLFKDAGDDLEINHVINVNFGGFRRAVNYVGGVYVDVDRRYYNDNTTARYGEAYATIDVQPGYQKLKGQDALDYVRYRHGDNDLVRAARQQDFLRQAKNAAGVRRLLAGGLGEKRHLIQVFSRYFRVDESLRSNKQVLSLLKLAIYLSTKNPKVNEVKFRAHDAPNPQVDSNLYVNDGDLKTVFREFMSPEGTAVQRKSPAKPAAADSGTTKTRKKRRKPADTEIGGLEATRTEGENMAVIADPKLKFPFYFPSVRVKGSTYVGTEPRIYTIKDETGKKRQAYRMVLHAPGVGEYYGVQGLTWKAPPILDDPDRTVRRHGRKLRLYYDGRNLRLVAWKTKNAVYWISNTLTQGIGEEQMLEIAGSLRKLKQ